MTIVIGGSSPSVTFPDSTVQNTAGLPLTGGTLSGPVTVPTLNAPSGVLATQNGMTGIAKAWVSFSGNGSVTISQSFNISSITRTNTGQYTINFTTAMPNSGYSAVLGVLCVSSPYLSGGSIVSQSTSSLGISTAYYSNYLDASICNVVVLGS
jgi:hypothetical protein